MSAPSSMGAAVPAAPPTLATPRGLEVWSLEAGGDEFALVAWPSGRGAGAAEAPALTPGEAAVASLAVTGLSNAGIARARGSSPRTVANQLASVFRKLGVASRLELFAWYGRGGAAPRRQ